MIRADIFGLIAEDAEVKEISGEQYVSFSVAFRECRRDQRGKRINTNIKIRVIWYGIKDKQLLLPSLKKGVGVRISGYLRVEAYNDGQDKAQASMSIHAFAVQPLIEDWGRLTN